MENLPGWLGALGALFGIIVVVAAATAVIWSTAAQKRAEALESTNEALDTRVRLLEKDNTELSAIKKTLEQRVHVLEDIVTNKHELAEMGMNIVQHQEELRTHHTVAVTRLNEIDRKLDGITKKVDLIDRKLARRRDGGT